MDHPKLEEWKTVWRERRSVTMVYPAAHLGCVGHAGTDFQRQL